MQQMIRQDRDEYVSFNTFRLLMKVGPQPQFIFEVPEGIFYCGQHDIKGPYSFVVQVGSIGTQEITAVIRFSQFVYIKAPGDIHGIVILGMHLNVKACGYTAVLLLSKAARSMA